MSVKINRLEIENVKRIRAVQMEPSSDGLTIIGGKNRQGKTSVLDAIAWGLGGERFRPSNPQNEDSVIPPSLKVTLSNGVTVERKGKNSALIVTDPSGQKAGQALLDSFVENLALNLPKFMEMNNKDKARVMLQVIGKEKEVAELDAKEQEIYQERLYKGREKEQKEKYAKELTYYEDAPEEPISASDLIKEQQFILAKNGENQRKRDKLSQLLLNQEKTLNELASLEDEIERLQKLADKKKEDITSISADIEIGKKSVSELKDESTEEIEASIANIEMINKKVQTNIEKKKAEEDSKKIANEYAELSQAIECVRKEKIELLNNANLPLEGLSVADGELTYLGDKWDNMSGSDQLKVSASIVRAVNPDCGFVLMDKLEQMDEDSLKEFGMWLEKENLQVIATRVTTDEKECQIIIEDGLAVINTTINEDKKEEEKSLENFEW